MPSDLAPALLRHGYQALARARADRGLGPVAVDQVVAGHAVPDAPSAAGAAAEDGDAFTARMLGRRTLVVRGSEGARLLYDESRIRRRGAVPPPLAALLFGRGAVHGLDGDEHRARKRIFLDLLTDEAVGSLAARVDDALGRAVHEWALAPSVRLHDGLVRVYGSAVLDWGGTGCVGREAEDVAHDLAAIVAGFGFQPGAYARGWAARLRCNRWARDLVARTRAGEHRPAEGTAVHAFALGAGADLPVAVAAVDLLNVLRPAVAVSWLGTFAALTLAQHPASAAPLLGHEADRHLEAFAQEVRRRTPFAPALTGLASRDFSAAGHDVCEGDRILLDVTGTNLHSREWAGAAEFRPDRFLHDDPGPYRFVPHGGGGPLGHRCPGEDVTTALLVVTLRHLARTGFTLTCPEVRTDRMPALPHGGLLMSDVVSGADGSGPFVPAP